MLDPDLGVKFNLNFEKIESLNILKKTLLSQIFNFFPQSFARPEQNTERSRSRKEKKKK
jgi:hypothetical protein